eukprot:485252-Prorocentrum_minimum.AAC.3
MEAIEDTFDKYGYLYESEIDKWTDFRTSHDEYTWRSSVLQRLWFGIAFWFTVLSATIILGPFAFLAFLITYTHAFFTAKRRKSLEPTEENRRAALLNFATQEKLDSFWVEVQDPLNNGETLRVHVLGLRQKLDTRSEDECLVIVHGTVSIAACFGPILKRAEKDGFDAVYAIDLPGFGISDGPGPTYVTPNNLENVSLYYAEVLTQIMKQLPGIKAGRKASVLPFPSILRFTHVALAWCGTLWVHVKKLVAGSKPAIRTPHIRSLTSAYVIGHSLGAYFGVWLAQHAEAKQLMSRFLLFDVVEYPEYSFSRPRRVE